MKSYIHPLNERVRVISPRDLHQGAVIVTLNSDGRVVRETAVVSLDKQEHPQHAHVNVNVQGAHGECYDYAARMFVLASSHAEAVHL